MVRVLVCSDMTISGLTRPLQNELDAFRGMEAEWQVVEQGFNQWLVEILDPSSSLNLDKPEFLIVLLSPRFLEEDEQAELKVKQFLNAIDLWNGHTRVLFSEFVADSVAAGRLIEIPRRQKLAGNLNAWLEQFQKLHRWFQVIDMSSFFVEQGLDKIHDPRYEILARMYFSPGGSRTLASYMARYLRALTIPAKKVLVLDLDNTLWGGILGEEGLGIHLGSEGIGYAYRRFQQALLTLKNQGVLLALCSKNNEADVWEVFDKHPSMVLKLSDFAGYRINWLSKVENLQSLAEELNLSLVSFAVFDDSPFEREQMLRLLPEIDILNVPKDPADYIRTLSDYSGFDRLFITEEDVRRSEMYQAEAQRKSLQKQASSLEDFYRSLEMTAEIKEVNASNFERVFQLIQKTNQFNLTTKRYSEAELHKLIESPSAAVYMLRLNDKLGESGLTGVLIIHMNEKEWFIENFLLSCRIIGRTVEYALMQWLVEKARKKGVKHLIGHFIPTSKNQPAAQFFKNAGFDYDSSTDQWTLDVEHVKIPKNYVKLEEKS